MQLHIHIKAQNFFESKNNDILHWAPCSRDFNPIEKLRSILVSRVYSNKKDYDNIGDLKKAIQEVWDGLEIDLIRKFVNSFPKQLIEVVAAKGESTDNS